jgi:hypothetical protein
LLKVIKTFISLTFFFLVVSPCHAKDVFLFDKNGNQIENYRELIDSLRPGDILVFNHGQYRYEFRERLGSGNTTEVIKVFPQKTPKGGTMPMALRVPINKGHTAYSEVRHETPYTKYIEFYKKGAKSLSRSGVRVPQIYDHFKDQFVLVELISPAFDLNDFLVNSPKVDQRFQNEAEDALYKFVQSTMAYERIGDFNQGQVVYDRKKKEWVLLDFTDKHKKIPILTGRQDSSSPYKLLRYSVKDTAPEYSARAHSIIDNIDSIVNKNSNRCQIFFKNLSFKKK